MTSRIDSNTSNLSYAVETEPGVLPATPVWRQLEPNSYSDFGGQVKTLARSPITAGRQRKKGAIVDLDASGGFEHDFVQSSLNHLLQAFFFASMNEKFTSAPVDGAAVVLTGVTATEVTAAAGLAGVLDNSLVFGTGFAVAANNGLHLATAASSTTAVTLAGLATEAAPPATSKLAVVGYEFDAGALSVDVSNTYPRLVRASGAVDFTTFGLRAGEWIYVGGDLAASTFATAGNTGFCRVRAVAAGYIELDKTSQPMATDSGAGKNVRVFFGAFLRNEKNPALQVKRYLQLERTLGDDGAGIQSEYITGSLANEFKLNIPEADKITCSFSFVGTDSVFRTGTEGLKSGDRPTLVSEDAINTSSDMSRIRLSLVGTDTAPAPLFAYATKLDLTIKNGVAPAKAIGTLGAIGHDLGDFTVSGSMEVYFASIAAVNAVRTYADVTLEVCVAKNNAGFVFDVPLLGLGDGRANVEKDKSIKLPLSADAAESAQGYTFGYTSFPYLPTVAL